MVEPVPYKGLIQVQFLLPPPLLLDGTMNIREEYMKMDWCHCSNGVIEGNCTQCDKEINDLKALI